MTWSTCLLLRFADGTSLRSDLTLITTLWSVEREQRVRRDQLIQHEVEQAVAVRHQHTLERQREQDACIARITHEIDMMKQSKAREEEHARVCEAALALTQQQQQSREAAMEDERQRRMLEIEAKEAEVRALREERERERLQHEQHVRETMMQLQQEKQQAIRLHDTQAQEQILQKEQERQRVHTYIRSWT